MAKIYSDTNVLRYFGTAFARSELPNDLREHLLLAPLSVMELLSQLGTSGAEEAFAAVQAFPKTYNPKASGMLPWSDDTFRISVFGLPPGPDVITPALNNAVVRVLNTPTAADLLDAGKEMRAMLDVAKEGTTKQFSDVLDGWRTEGSLPKDEHRAIFARSIATRAGIDRDKVDVDTVLKALGGLYTFESTKLKIGANEPGYKVEKHSNDVYDAELLIYLADPTLHLLTSDGGFRRVQGSPQYRRVHIVPPGCLLDPDRAADTIRGILNQDEVDN